MDKVNTFAGQPILSQILDCIPSATIRKVVRKHKSNYYYKKIPFRVHLVTLVIRRVQLLQWATGVMRRMFGCEGKLNYLGFDKAPARSTLSDADTKRTYLSFESLYFELLQQYHGLISDSRLKGLSIRNLKIIDSTTIELFSEILRGVGRNPIGKAKRKGGIKVHTVDGCL